MASSRRREALFACSLLGNHGLQCSAGPGTLELLGKWVFSDASYLCHCGCRRSPSPFYLPIMHLDHTCHILCPGITPLSGTPDHLRPQHLPQTFPPLLPAECLALREDAAFPTPPQQGDPDPHSLTCPSWPRGLWGGMSPALRPRSSLSHQPLTIWFYSFLSLSIAACTSHYLPLP